MILVKLGMLPLNRDEFMISVTILTKNSQKHLKEILDSLHSFDEVVVCDTGSTDCTLEIARAYSNVLLYEKPFAGFGPTHNFASERAKNDWILSIDSDEVPSPELIEEIMEESLDPRCVYSIPRRNFFNGKWIRWCGWHPESVVRLYHRGSTCFSDEQVHEAVITQGLRVKSFKGALKHYSYDSIDQFLEKMQLYSELFAKQNVGKKRSGLGKAIAHGFYGFFKSFFLKRGFMGGFEGAVISFYNGHTAYYKYLKLREYNRKFFDVQRKMPDS